MLKRKMYDQEKCRDLVQQVNAKWAQLLVLDKAWDLLHTGDKGREEKFVLSYLEDRMKGTRADATFLMIELHRSWMTVDEAMADAEFYLYTRAVGLPTMAMPVQTMYGTSMGDPEEDPAPISARLVTMEPDWSQMFRFMVEFPLT